MATFRKNDSSPFKRQSHKMIKHTQTIRRLLPMNYWSVFDHFVGLVLKGLKFFDTVNDFISLFA